MARHEDDGLPHKEQEQPPKQGQYQYQRTKQEQTGTENIIDKALPVETRKKLVGSDVFGDQIKSYTDNLCRQHTKNVGYNYKQHTRDKPPAVFVKKLIKVREVFHLLL